MEQKPILGFGRLSLGILEPTHNLENARRTEPEDESNIKFQEQPALYQRW